MKIEKESENTPATAPDLIPVKVEPREIEPTSTSTENDRLINEMVAIQEKFNCAHFELEKTKRLLETVKDDAEIIRNKNSELCKSLNEYSTKYAALLRENKMQKAQIDQLRLGILTNEQQETEKPNIDKASSDTDSNVYFVENILERRIRRKKVQYLIKWKNYDSSWNTWENEKNLNCPAILKKFKKEHGFK